MFDTEYGISYKVDFEDKEGNSFVWWTSSVDADRNELTLKEQKISFGSKIMLKATVKKHSQYKERKQTIISRCNLIEIMQEGKMS